MLRPRAHIIKKVFTGRQVTVTIPKHIAQACGLFCDGYVSFQVNEAGELTIENFPPGENDHANRTPALALDRPAPQPA